MSLPSCAATVCDGSSSIRSTGTFETIRRVRAIASIVGGIRWTGISTHRRGWRPEFLAEGPGLTHLDEMVRRNAGRLRVYDLDSIGSLAKR